MAGEFMSTESLRTCLGRGSRRSLFGLLGGTKVFGESREEQDPGYLGRHRLEARN